MLHILIQIKINPWILSWIQHTINWMKNIKYVPHSTKQKLFSGLIFKVKIIQILAQLLSSTENTDCSWKYHKSLFTKETGNVNINIIVHTGRPMCSLKQLGLTACSLHSFGMIDPECSNDIRMPSSLFMLSNAWQ